MAYLNWNDDMSVNVEVIDRQHRELLELINQLHEAMTRGEGNAVLHRIIDGLLSYTEIHFATEERYFESLAYPDIDRHKQEHRDFVSRATDFKQGFDEGRLMLSLDVMSFLGDWLVGHIQGTDASYVPFAESPA